MKALLTTIYNLLDRIRFIFGNALFSIIDDFRDSIRFIFGRDIRDVTMPYGQEEMYIGDLVKFSKYREGYEKTSWIPVDILVANLDEYEIDFQGTYKLMYQLLERIFPTKWNLVDKEFLIIVLGVRKDKEDLQRLTYFGPLNKKTMTEKRMGEVLWMLIL